MQFDRIPKHMRAYRQWVCWRSEWREGSTKPTKVPYSPVSRTLASVIDPQSWASYDEAVEACQRDGYNGIGFVFTNSDPFAGIDLDDTEGDVEAAKRQVRIYEAFDSYSERSPSGNGLHIIIMGSVPNGRRRDHVEVYSSERYFTMTGDAYGEPRQIADCNELLTTLWNELAPNSAANPDASAFYGTATESDEAIYQRALAATNGTKFMRLWNGEALDLSGDTSGSAIDMALVDMLQFYTNDPAQIERLWLASPHGQRTKTQNTPGYRQRTIERAFDREVAEPDLSGVIAEIDAKRLANSAASSPFQAKPSKELLPTMLASDFAGQPVNGRAWHVLDLIPRRNVTLLYGDGGTGKSLAALQLCASTALGRSWFGSAVQQGSALFFTAEDEFDEVHRRLVDIAAAERVALESLCGLAVSSLADRDALLAAPVGRGGGLAPTVLYTVLSDRIAVTRPALVVIDTLADTFGGNEIDRSQARWFVGQLRRLAIEFDTAVVVLAHPSQQGMTSGSGASGSTGWNNSVRSRLYFESDPTNPSNRILTTKKSNYGPKGGQVRVRWERGVFVEVDRASSQAAHREASELGIDELFLRLLADFTQRGQTVSRVPQSIDHAPKLFAKHREAGNHGKRDFAEAMNRLFAQGRIADGWAGEFQSKQKRVIVLVDAAEGTSNSPSNSTSNEFPAI